MESASGFLFLDECRVFVSESSSQHELVKDQWCSVHWSDETSTTDTGPSGLPQVGLHLQCTSDPLVMVLVDGADLSWDGTVQSLPPHLLSSSSLSPTADAVLLLSLVKTCHQQGNVHISAVRVCLHKKTPRAMSLSKTSTETYLPYSASFLITVDFPLLHNVKRLLPANLQLILSIVQSDKLLLRHILQCPSHFYPQASRPTFFPPKLSVDEVYQRIGSAHSHLYYEGHVKEEVVNAEPTSCIHSSSITILHLPQDVIRYHIGPYLRSKALYTLSTTNRFFHRCLRGVVPGLRLRLYDHQVKSLTWMRQRESAQLTENHMNMRGPDIHRAATGGTSVVLSCPGDGSSMRIRQDSGVPIVLRADDPLARRVARGGLLCDDPGLGKTITVLSLFLQTLGLTTESPTAESTSNDTNETNERIFAEYWREQSIPTLRCEALQKLINSFLRTHRDAYIFVQPVDPDRDDAPDYYEVIQQAISIKEIRSNIDRMKYDPSFKGFNEDVERCFRNAMEYNSAENSIHTLADGLLKAWMTHVNDFKQKQIQIAKTSFSRASSKPNSSVAALVDEAHEQKFRDSLLPSSCTLLVVPSVLIEHWQDQIRMYMDPKYCMPTRSQATLIFEFTGSEMVPGDSTNVPLIFIDKGGTRKLPPAEDLVKFRMVITTIQRFTNEWKNGSFEEELRQSDKGVYQELETILATSTEACSLLRVRWLRMIVDEGHSMGRGNNKNSAIAFASWISAERRWAMTGTPTRQTTSQTAGLTNIRNLLQYLQHNFFSRRNSGDSDWQSLISRGWIKGSVASFFRMQALLSLLMVRHTKQDIRELPPPTYRSKYLPMSEEEIKTYNTLVSAVQSNLLLTSMKGKTSGAQDSLLHRSQHRHARTALRNARLVCAGGTRVVPTISSKFFDEFISYVQAYNPDPTVLDKMKSYIARATTEGVTPCDCCGMLLTTQLVFPCGDLVCTECFDPTSTECVVCNTKFDVDVVQRLQPGLDYQWLSVAKEDESQTPPVEGLIHADGSGVLAPPNVNVQRRRTATPSDGHKCVFSRKNTSGKCELCWKEHEGCDMMNFRRQCETCFRVATECPSFETKPHYIVNTLVGLHEELISRRNLTTDADAISAIPPLKVIVFSQFRDVLNTTGDRLLRRLGTGRIAEYWGRFRTQELHKFVHDPTCLCMLLGRDGSEGLDLSFVTHIFFLEPVWDKSLEQQVVGRAWRMGTKQSVIVETLVAENSVEVTMAELELDVENGINKISYEIEEPNSIKAAEYQNAKMRYLLKTLQLITSSATNPLQKPAFAFKKRGVQTPLSAVDVPIVEHEPSKRRRVQFA